MNQPPKLLDQLRNAIRLKHYPLSTERAYVSWAKRYILFHNKKHPMEMDASHIQAFLTDLAVVRHVAASCVAYVHHGRARGPAPYGVNTLRTGLFFGGQRPLPAVTG